MVFITAPSITVARQCAMGMVEAGLAACVNLIPGIESVYWWQNQVHQDQEVLLIAKTTVNQWPLLRDWVKTHHPYEVPEIIQLPIAEGQPDYLSWIAQTVQRPINT